MENFCANLHYRLEIYRVSKKHTDLYLSSDFNVFDYIYPDENALSDIIAEFLDPVGSHGQGSIFLEHFLREIDINKKIVQSPSIKREDTTGYIRSLLRRIDITLSFDNPVLYIGIENKPWAEDQKDQIKDYIDHLNKKSNGNFILVYLSDDGKEPESLDPSAKKELIAKGKLKIVPYMPKLTLWLEKCIKDCESEKIRWFLRDFLRYIEHNFKAPEELENK